ncbi:MAG: serine/threonine protein phosphatase [Alphaproteobacteria bacterium]|nr:serine/threonine protein phosphatase [Alphaproteobacteria bacterium]
MAADAGAPRGAAGARAYAIGDIHGRLDLLDLLLRRIDEDRAARPTKKSFIIFLGDLIDRGPDSAGVVERLRQYRPSGARAVFLGGNHEEVLLRILAGEKNILASWLKFGGAECLESYGVDAEALRHREEGEAIRLLQANIPMEHRQFLESFADTFRFGDYLFVHAGIRPGVAIDAQDKSDLRWIREPFLTDAKEHGCVVVHGHTIVEKVEERRNRIGIDTGAYQSGVLTALAIEDAQRWFLATAAGEGQSLGCVSAAA